MPSKPFKPNYAPSPGRVLNTHLEHHGMSAAEFARRSGRSVEFIQELISGAVPLDRETALHIAKEFGGGAETWMNMETGYRQKLARDAEKRARREAMRGRILFFPRILSRAYRSLGSNQRGGMPRRS